ncbi:putative uncharacterized protein [Eubacterium sp. CAG:252]|nr:putative uncharacterized protein [Eubacterium sp. CAG:252]
MGIIIFLCNLSKSKNISDFYNILKVYVPLFGDDAYHNCNILVSENGGRELDNHIFDVENIADMFWYYEYEKCYYNKENRKKITGYPFAWNKISDIQKRLIGYERVTIHNKNLNRKLTYKENLMYLNELINFCNRKGIKLLFVVMSATQYYRDYLNNEFINKFYETLNEIEFPIHVLDLFDSGIFNV